MGIVKLDIQDGNRGEISFNGWSFNRVAVVSELTGAPSAMLIEAATTPGVPQMDDSHPFITDAYVVAVEPKAIANNVVTLDITYRQFTPDIRVSVGERNVISTLNRHYTDQVLGTRENMTLQYTYPDPFDFDPDPGGPDSVAGTSVEQGVKLHVSMGLPEFTFNRTEWLTTVADALSGHPIGIQMTGNIALDRVEKFNDSLNSTVWNVRPNAPLKTWQCKMSATSTGNGFDWRFVYKFSFDPLQWAFGAVFEDPYSNQPVPDPDNPETIEPGQDASAKLFDQFLVRDFNLLGIT